MKCIPRASFSIAILDDEDFGVLMEDPSGMEAFGLFVAIIIAGRSRLQLERAERVGQTDALVFADRNRHLLSMIHADQGQFDRCIAAFARVARETGGEPWVHLDQGGHLVIRSFFKFNTNTGWGGSRGGAGRKSSCNQDGQDGNQVFQDDSISNHLEKNGPVGAQSSFSSGLVGGKSSVSSGIHSGTGTGTGTGTIPLTPKGGEVCVSTNGSEPESISKALPSEPAKPPFDDAELTRVGQRAEKLFPMADFGGKIKAIAGDGPSEFPLAWIDSALTEMHATDKRDWRYLMGILRRYAADGGPKPSAQSGPRIHNPNPPPPPGGSYWRSPATLARLAARDAAEAAKKSKREAVAS